MIDKLDFRIEPEIPFTSEFESVYRRIRSRAQPTDYYMEVLNLRQYGIGAILHLHCRFNANHKVELLQTARMPVGAMAREVEKIFDCQAQELSLARVDLASDVPGITVGWFRIHMRVKHKRSMREIASRTNEKFANGCTLYYGGGSDIVRVYDKIAQLQHQSGRIGRWGPSQYTNCMESGGLPTKGSVLTRIERQMRRIPNELATLNDLQRNASRFNPFKSVVLFSGGKPKPNPDQYRVARYLQGIGLRHTIEEIGLAATWDMLNGNSGGNAKRVIRRLAEFIPADAEGFQIPNLFQMYRESVSHQVSGGIPPTDSVLERTIVHR